MSAGRPPKPLVTVSMTIELILYRGKRDNEEYTQILKKQIKTAPG